MSRHNAVFVLTISDGNTESNVIVSRVGFGGMVDCIIVSPTTLPETVKVYVSAAESTSSSDFQPLYVNGSDVTIPAAKAVAVPASAFNSLMLIAGSAVGGDREFKLICQYEV